MAVGPSTTTSPYLLPSKPSVRFTSVVTTGDPLPGDDGPFAGEPDGLAAFDNGDGTITVLVVHQLGTTSGSVRDHGVTGSFIDRLIVDKATLAVTSADDLIKSQVRWNETSGTFYTSSTRMSHLAAGDLAAPTAFYNAATGLGTNARIMIAGEENGLGSRMWAAVVNGAQAGTLYELAFLGNMDFERAIANPFAQDKTIVAITEDESDGQVYFYIGQKQATGSDVVKAGLVGGDLFGLKVTGVTQEVSGTPLNGTFTLQEIGPGGDVSKMTGSQIESESDLEGVTGFLRPEGSVWDPTNPNVMYFVTTHSFTGNSRLYKLTFTDITQPELGGRIEALLVGNEGQRMLDNIEISGGKLILGEDPGDKSYLSRIWEYDIATDQLKPLAEFDKARFVAGNPDYITQDEEVSGLVDITAMLGLSGTRAYLVNSQLHVHTAAGTTELGQLAVMYVDEVQEPVGRTVTFGSAVDTHLREARPTTNYSSATTVLIDGDSGAVYQALMAFTGLFGDGPGQIPIGATITSALLTLNTTNSTATGASIYRMTTDWNAASTWSSLGNGVQVGAETAASADLTLSRISSGTGSFDVTASINAWLSGAITAADANSANKGWVFIANGTDGWDFTSSEGSVKPVLTISYTLPSGATGAATTSLTTMSSETDDPAGSSGVDGARPPLLIDGWDLAGHPTHPQDFFLV